MKVLLKLTDNPKKRVKDYQMLGVQWPISL